MAAGGDHDKARALIAQISDPGQRVRALAWLAEAAVAGGDHGRVTRFTAVAEVFTAQVSSLVLRAEVLAWLAEAAAAARGEHNKAEAFVMQISKPIMRAEGLAWLAGRVAGSEDHDWVARLIDEAESLIAQVPAGSRGRALARLAGAVAIGGDHDRAEALTGQIAEPNHRGEALGRLADAAAAGGDYDRAEALIARISDVGRRALALARFAVTLVETIQKTSPGAEHAHSSSLVMVRARRLLAEALVTSSWTKVVVGLARVDPLAVSALADELQVRWGLDRPGSPRDGPER